MSEKSVAHRNFALAHFMVRYRENESSGRRKSEEMNEKGEVKLYSTIFSPQKAEGGFPPNVNILEAVDFYFQMCSVEVDCKTIASIASTYANNGKNPLSDKYVALSQTL